MLLNMRSLKKMNSLFLLAMVRINSMVSIPSTHPSTGIWDCLSSQNAVDFIRRKVYEGKELSEIGEMMFDHCLAPDTSSGAGIGCDNMTLVIVAILHGRTKEEWYDWVRNRVEKNYGYETAEEPPQLYSASRLMSFKTRRAAEAERERLKKEREESGQSISPFSGLARAFGSSSGISFHPVGGISSGPLMFGNDDSDDDSEDELGASDLEAGTSIFTNRLGIGSDSPDVTMNLKAQLEEFERDQEEDGDGYFHMNDDSEIPIDDGMRNPPPRHPQSPSPEPVVDGRTAETLPPPQPLPNGEAVIPVEQLKSHLAGDPPSPVVKAEGFLDSSEDPLKVIASA
jgi:protein phosphatase 2C family protein 2/3